MVTKRIGYTILAALCVGALLGSPSSAAAQNTVFITPFEATFINPCVANDSVAVTGSSTTTLSDTVTPTGDRRIAVSVVTRGTGIGTPSGESYVFSESQNFNVKAPMIGEEFDSTFSDKLSLKGAGPTDNWVIRAYFRIKINAAGDVLVSIDRMNADTCKG